MVRKSIVCIVIFAVVRGQNVPHEHSYPSEPLESPKIIRFSIDPATVSVNHPKHYFINGTASSISPLPRPNVYVTSRRKRSPAIRDVSCPYEELANEAKVSGREWSREEDVRNSEFIRRRINNSGCPQEESNRLTFRQRRNNGDQIRSLNVSPLVGKNSRRNKQDTPYRGNNRHRPKHRSDRDTHWDRSKIHSNSPGARGNERDRNRHRFSHGTYCGDSESHSSSRESSFRDHLRPQPRTLYDKRQIFTDVKKSKRQ